jgi:hypothetical protein
LNADERAIAFSRREVRQVRVEPPGDLLALHARAGIELRLVPLLHPPSSGP